VLKITLKSIDGTTIVGCQGQIAQNEEIPLLCLVVGLGERAVILDLTHTTAIDRSGFGVLISLQAAGIFLTLRNPSEHVLRELRLRQMQSLFQISRCAPEAVPA